MIGVGVFVVVPMLRSTILAPRNNRPPVDVRFLGRSGAPARDPEARPELWLTPTATETFPSADHKSEVVGAAGSVTASYRPERGPGVLALPAIAAVGGRSPITVLAFLGVDDDWRTPAPNRPIIAEVSQITLLASVGAAEHMAGCVIALRDGAVTVVQAIPPATTEGCASGTLRLSDESSLWFAFEYDVLPNVRERDGAWREGGVFGQVQVVAGRAPAGA